MRVPEIEDENAGPINPDMLGSSGMNDSEANLRSSESSEDEEVIIEEVLEDEASNEDEDSPEEREESENIPETVEQNIQHPAILPNIKDAVFLDLDKTADTDNAILTEARYCTVCNLEQPVRAKH